MYIRPARQEEITKIHDILIEAQLPTEGIDKYLSNFYVGLIDERIIAAGGLEVHGVFGLLRSVVVIPEYQRHGFARSLCDTIINQASQLNLSAVYLITETAERYFTKLDFAIVPRENAPIDIRNTQEFKELCPESAILMCLDLS